MRNAKIVLKYDNMYYNDANFFFKERKNAKEPCICTQKMLVINNLVECHFYRSLDYHYL